MSKASHPFTFTHPACGGPAFHRVSIPCVGEARQLSDYEHVDGRPVAQGDPFECGTCGQRFNYQDVDDMLNPRNWKPRE
jgi:hypothetical protein